MGSHPRRKPKRLAEKLYKVRMAFGDSQNELIRRLGLQDELNQSDISAFERGTREPSLPVLLKYSEVACVWVNAFIDDEIDLPEKIQRGPMKEGVQRTATKRNKRQRNAQY
jgi:transcriptional regulator with XRE-family HTH domain